MSVTRPTAACVDLPFAAPCALEPAAQVALEDYARVVTSATASEARVTGTGVVEGLHLCGLANGVTAAAERDIADFAHELGGGAPGRGLGWS